MACLSYKIKLPGLTDFNNFDIDYSLNLISNFLKRYLIDDNMFGFLDIDIFFNQIYGVIMEINFLEDKDKNEYVTKILFHVDSYFLYEIDYFDIDEALLNNGIVYYYKDKFYLYLKQVKDLDKYLRLTEFANIIYGDDSLIIINDGIKLTNYVI